MIPPILIPMKKKIIVPTFETVTISDILPIGFVESNLSLNSPTIGDDAYMYIQNELNKSNSHNHLTVIWDKAVALSTTLRIGGNTTINVSTNKGAILMNNKNCPLIMNRNLRFRFNNRIVDKNIIINGGVWNGNNAGQTSKGTALLGLSNIFSFFGVDNLQLRNHKMFTPKVYCQQATNIINGIVEDFIIDVGVGAINMDGVHFDGWCKDCRISRGNIKTFDDGVGINADDLYYSMGYGDGVAVDFFTEDPCGPASNILIEDLVFQNSLFGVRILSSHSRVDNITIKNLSGICRGYSVIIDNYWQNPTAIQNSGVGNVGTINIDNNSTVVNYSGFEYNEGKTSLSCSIENLIITNDTINTGTTPNIAKKAQDNAGGVYVYGNLTLNGVPF